jgi:hypothetical protein
MMTVATMRLGNATTTMLSEALVDLSSVLGEDPTNGDGITIH